MSDVRLTLETDEVLTLRATAEYAGHCGFEDEHLGATFAGFREYCEQHGDAATWKALGRYLRDLGAQTVEGRGWIIEGPTGTGKTAVLALIAEAECLRGGAWHEPDGEAQFRGLAERKPRALKVPAVQLADFFNQINHEGEEWARQFALYRIVRHLMIDDMGTEYLSGTGGNALYQLIDERYTRRLCTHLTLNMLLDELATSAPNAKRIASRILQRSFRMSLIGPDRRKPLAMSLLDGVEFGGER